MNKEKINEEIRKAYSNGQSDEYVSQMLCDQANLYVSYDVDFPEDISEEEKDILIEKLQEAYIEGFYGTEELSTFLMK